MFFASQSYAVRLMIRCGSEQTGSRSYNYGRFLNGIFQEEQMENQRSGSKGSDSVEGLGRAESITLTDFSTALSAGIIRAIDARGTVKVRPEWRPWIWAGWIIGDGPLGPGGGPFGPGGPAGPSGPFNQPGG
jgi:hypothetical protein